MKRNMNKTHVGRMVALGKGWFEIGARVDKEKKS